MSTTINYNMNNIESASALFEMFESMESNPQSSVMYQSSSSSAPSLFSSTQSGSGASASNIQALSSSELDSKPRQVLGESVFNQFVKSQELNSEFPLGFEKIEVPELSPSVGTITPLQLHSSIVESVFDPISENQSPMFDEVELDSENWSSLFEPNELEIKPTVEKQPMPQASSHSIDEVAKPMMKRSSSEAELDIPSIAKKQQQQSSSTPSPSSSPKPQSRSNSSTDHLGVVSYNRKQRSAPLSPIQIDESGDPIAQKRARNTEAARRSRARKMERMNQLEDKVEQLISKNSALENEVLRLRSLLQESGQSF